MKKNILPSFFCHSTTPWSTIQSRWSTQHFSSVTSPVGIQLAARLPVGRDEKNLPWTVASQDMESNNIIES